MLIAHWRERCIPELPFVKRPREAIKVSQCIVSLLSGIYTCYLYRNSILNRIHLSLERCTDVEIL